VKVVKEKDNKDNFKSEGKNKTKKLGTIIFDKSQSVVERCEMITNTLQSILSEADFLKKYTLDTPYFEKFWYFLLFCFVYYLRRRV
jgi:hypothetical protein